MKFGRPGDINWKRVWLIVLIIYIAMLLTCPLWGTHVQRWAHRKENMAYILYYRGKGKALMSHVSEYVVLVDLDEVDDAEKQGNCAPGFQLHSCIEIDADITGLPTEEPLIPERYR